MGLFQYWDTGEPPDEVAEWIDRLRAINPGLRHTLYDRDQASWFIGKRVGARERRAFDSVLVPAMQADYFRLCALSSRGGIWVDADYQPVAPLDGALAGAPDSLLLSWCGHVDNSFMMCRAPGNPFVRACRDLVTLNIEARAPQRAYVVSGPGALSSVRLLVEPESSGDVHEQFQRLRSLVGDCADVVARARSVISVTPELRKAFTSARLVEVSAMSPWLSRRRKPAYKQTQVHWQNWSGPQYA